MTHPLLLVIITVFTLFSTTDITLAAGFGGEYSHGYRLGQVVKFSAKGTFTKSGEGEMLIGRSSSPYCMPIDKKTGKQKCLNPWKFSAEKPMWGILDSSVGKYVVLEYSQANIANRSAQDTDYTVVDLSEPTRELPDLSTCVFEKPASLIHAGGKRVGRIAKASYKGTLLKTYEYILQLGDSGSSFLEMSTQGQRAEAIHACATAVLKSGKPVTVLYVEQALKGVEDTPYVIYGFEATSDL